MEIAVWTIVGLFYLALLLVVIDDRYYRRRTDAWLARYNHRRALSHAAVAGETSVEFQAMQCTMCGGLHPEDDTECPNLV